MQKVNVPFLVGARDLRLRLSSIPFEMAIALGYALLVYFFFFGWETQWGLRIDFTTGSFWIRRICIPLGFWALTLVYGLLNSRSKVSWKTVVEVGLTFHLTCLLLFFLQEKPYLNLPSKIFSYYGYAMACLGLSIIGYYSLKSLIAAWKRELEEKRFAFLFLPFFYPLVLDLRTSLFLGFVSVLFLLLSPHFKKATKALEFPWVAPLLVFFIAWCFRIIAAHRLASMGLDTVLLNSDDAQQYHRFTLYLLDGKKITNHFSPGYTSLLYLFHLLFKSHLASILFFQATLCSSVAVGIYWIGKEIWDQRVGLVAGLLVALNQLLIFNSVNFTREAGSQLLGVWAFLLWIHIQKYPSRLLFLKIITLGALSSFLSLIDILFQPIFLLLPLSLLFRKELSKKQAACLISVFWVTFFAVMALLQWRLLGKVGMARNNHAAVVISTHYSAFSGELYKNGVNLFEFGWQSIPNFFKAPLHNLWLISAKILLDFKRYFLEASSGAFDPLTLVRNSFLAANLYFYAYLFGSVGFVLLIRRSRKERRWDQFWLYFVPCFYISFYVFLFFGYARFRAPMQPYLLLWLSIGLLGALNRNETLSSIKEGI